MHERPKRTHARLLLTLALLLTPVYATAQQDVSRATLANGLRVVVIRDTLAPVASVYLNYLVGGDETPPGFPGMAHAQEHMAFRGCAGLTADQTAAIFAQLGGDNDADTQQNITQFFETVPSQDLDVALRVGASCMRDIADSEAQWTQERGAIEQEVASDLSDPGYRMLVRFNEDLFADTPYAHDPLGTKASFDSTTGAMLEQFYTRWYAPNNAVLVVVGDVQPPDAIQQVTQLYGSIPRRAVPPRPPVELHAVAATQFTLPSDYPYSLTALAFRLPGTDSPAYAATRVLADVLASQRGDLYALVAQGRALDAGFELVETYRRSSMGVVYVAVPAGAGAASMDTVLRRIVSHAARHGVPSDLVAAAKRSEITSAEFARTSIPGLARLWSQALAAEGRESPEQDVQAIARVSLTDVDDVARTYLTQQAAAATLTPEPAGQVVASSGFGGAEKVTSQPSKPVALPEWAERALHRLDVPTWHLQPTDTTLANGLRVIVQPEPSTPTVSVKGEVREQPDLETPPGEEGVNGVVEGLFSYGTTSLDRIAFLKALDEIGAEESAGPDFTLGVLAKHFERGVQLLADNELHPAFPDTAFRIVRRQTAAAIAGELRSPAYLAHRALLAGLLPKRDPELRQPTPQDIEALTLPEVERYYTAVFRPDLTTIVVIGDVRPARAVETIARYFGAWQATGPKPPTDLPAVPPNAPAQDVVPDPAREQDAVVLAQELPMNRFNPDYYSLEVGNHVLGGGFYATRLYRALREETGYVYYVANALEAHRTRSTFVVQYGCDPQNVSKARGLIVRDLEAMQASDVDADELHQAKAMLLRQIPLAESGESAIAAGFVDRAILGLPLDEPVRAGRIYAAVTADQIRAAFTRWIRPQDLVQVVRGPPPR